MKFKIPYGHFQFFQKNLNISVKKDIFMHRFNKAKREIDIY